MADLSDYERWKQDRAQNAVKSATVVLGSVAEDQPDQVAGDLALARKYAELNGGTVPPVSLVSANRSVFQNSIDRLKAETVLANAPRLTDWMRNPQNAALAKDDLEGLSWFETGVGSVRNAVKRFGMSVPQTYNQFMASKFAGDDADLNKSFGQLLEEERDTMTSWGTGEKISGYLGPQDLLAAGLRYGTSRWTGLMSGIGVMGDPKQVAAGYQMAADDWRRASAGTAMSPGAEKVRQKMGTIDGDADLLTQLSQFAGIVAEDPLSFLSFTAQTAVESAPTMALAAGVGAATRNPNAVAATMGLASGAREYGATATDIVAASGHDLSTPEGALAAISDPELMKKANDAGMTRAIVVGALDGLSAGVAGKALSQSHAGNMVLQTLTQGIMGAAGEGLGQFASGQKMNLADILMEGIAEFASAPGEVASMAASRIGKVRTQANQAAETQKVMAEITKRATESRLRQRMPDHFRDFVQKATDGTGADTVYIDGKTFNQHFVDAGLDPAKILSSIPGVGHDDLDIAIAGGGDIAIPTASYAAHLAGSEHDQFFIDHMKFSPDEMSAAEAAEFEAKKADYLDEAWRAAEEVRAEEESWRSAEAKIYDSMISQLRAAGLHSDRSAAEVQPLLAYYRTRAERLGMTVEDYMAKHPLPSVRGAIPEGIQWKNVDDLSRDLAALRTTYGANTEKAPSLLEFVHDYGGVNDPHGEIKAVVGSTEVKQGRGKKTLRLVRNEKSKPSKKAHGLDDVAFAAVEAGYLAEDPAVLAYQQAVRDGTETPDLKQAFLDALGAEMRGEKMQVPTRSQQTVEYLDQLESYLNSLGLDVSNTDEEIRSAIEADRADAGKKYAQGPFGNITLGPDGSSVIRLFETANLSTLQHEMGHLFLAMMQQDAANGDASTIEEMKIVKAWWKSNAAAVAADGNKAMPDAKLTAADVEAAMDNGTTGDAVKDAAITIGTHEQWARGYEAYLFEGKAPSDGLRAVFQKFATWMLSVYKRMAGLNVEINDEIRSVFDRMLASDAEIQNAKESSGDAKPVFTSAEMLGLTPEEFDRLNKLRQASEDQAKSRLTREILEPIKRAKENWWQDETAKVTAEVEKHINSLPVYRAMEWIVNGRWLGDQDQKIPDIRLSKAALVEQYGEGILVTLGRDDIVTGPDGKEVRKRKPGWTRNAYSDDGGMTHNEAAGWFGFGSGDELVRSIERAPARKEAIKAEVDRRMFEMHGDPLHDGTAEQTALEAVHNDRRGEWLAAELKAVSEVKGFEFTLTAKESNAMARDTLSKMGVREATNSDRFLAAERKAGKEAAVLGAQLARETIWMSAGKRKIAEKARAALEGGATLTGVNSRIDRANTSIANRSETAQALIDAKRRQLINHSLYQESRRIAKEVDKIESFVRRLNKASMRERIAGAGRRENAQIDYLGAIDEILTQYDFRKIGKGADARRGALAAYIQRMTEAGREAELAIPDHVLKEASRTPYKKLSVDELRGVFEALKNLQHVALRWDELIDAQNARKLQETVSAIAQNMDENLPKHETARFKSGRQGEARRSAMRQYSNLVLNATTLLREIDGFEYGAAYEAIKAPIDEAENRLIVRKKKAAEDLEALYSVYSKEEQAAMNRPEFFPALGKSLTKWERIAIALNTGNDGNLQRLTDPEVNGSLSEGQVKAVLDSLNERDADFVQSVWNYVGSFKADISARDRRVKGVEPQWVDATPVVIGGKTLSGGYYPIKYDAALSSLTRDDEFKEALNGLKSGRFGKAQTRHGHLKARAEASGRPLDLDMSVLHRHINQVVYDLEFSEPVSNAWKIIQDGEIRSAFERAGRRVDFETLETWLLDVGAGQLYSSDLLSKTARMAKTNFTATKLAFNVGTALVQVSGLSQTAVVVGKKNMLIGVMNAIRPGVSEMIASKSAFMAERSSTFNKDIADFYNDPSLGKFASKWGSIKRDVIGPLAFWLMTKTQYWLVDIPTWVAGYHQGMQQFGDEAKAVQHADRIVKRSQSSGLFSDRSGIERGSVSATTRQNDVIRLFTTLASYMFAKFNIAYERGMKSKRVFQKEGLSVASAKEALSLSVDMVFLFTLEAVFTGLVKGTLPGLGGGGDDDDENWAEFLAKNTAFSVLGTLPGIRDVVSAGQGFESGGAYGGIVAEFAKPFTEILQGEVDKGLVKSVISATGLVAGIPGTTQVNRAVDAAFRASEGKDVAPVEYLLGKR